MGKCLTETGPKPIKVPFQHAESVSQIGTKCSSKDLWAFILAALIAIMKNIKLRQ